MASGKTYKYSLDSSSKKFECPKCGEKRLVKYINTETNQYLEGDFGRCDRENSCGYFLMPSGEIKTSSSSAPEKLIVYPNGKYEKLFDSPESPFHDWCYQLGITKSHLEKWRVGAGGRYTAFGIADGNNLLNIKHVPYGENGKRLRAQGDSPFYLSKKDLLDGSIYDRCLYGLHLYNDDKDVVLVESEKSAILASYFYPDLNWLATGGNNGLKASKLSVLYGGKNKIIYLPDNDDAGENNAIVKALEEINNMRDRVIFTKPFTNYSEGYDIADWIVEHINDITGNIEEDLSIDIYPKEESLAKQDPETTKTSRFYKWTTDALKAHYDVRYNLITRRIEVDGESIDTRTINSIYINLHAKGYNIKKDVLRDIIESDRVEEYHPLQEWFEQREHINESGLIRKVAQHFVTDTYSAEELELFIKKWMVGAVACLWPGNRNLLMLVLCGGQNTGKTEFFERLMPKGMWGDFCAEDKMDQEKDSLLLLAQKWLILDDEFGGKSKRDAKRFKHLISKKEVTVRPAYERYIITMDRIATFCGTSNEYDVLVDHTGNRRIIPVNVLGRNFKLFDSIDKEALWMEAYHLFKSGYKYKLEGDDVHRLNNKTEAFERHTNEYNLLYKYFNIPSHGQVFDESSDMKVYTPTEIKIELERISGIRNISNIEIGKALVAIGYPTYPKTRYKGRKGRFYCLVESDAANSEVRNDEMYAF